MIPRPRRTPSVAILIPNKNEEITKPSHIIPGYLIGQSGSVLTKKQRGNLRMQRFNNDESNGCKAHIQHQCSLVAFFDTLGFVCAEICETYGETALPMDTKIREKTFSTRIVAAYPASAVCRRDLQQPVRSSCR